MASQFSTPRRELSVISKLASDKGSWPEPDNQDYALRSQEIEMLEHLSRLQDGTLDVVEVKHGLPFKLVVEQSAS